MAILGLRGGDYDKPCGGEPIPAPLVWHQTHDSFTRSLADGGKQRLFSRTTGIGELACPGENVTFMRVSGSHGAGTGDFIPPESPTRKQHLTYRCSQSALAAKAKRGHDGERSDADMPLRKKKAVVPVSDCNAFFSIRMKNTMSRTSHCSICGKKVTYSSSASPDPVQFPLGKVDGTCPWDAQDHVVQSGFRVVKAATCHTGHWARVKPLFQRVPTAVALRLTSS